MKQEQAIDCFSALAQESRLSILRFLVRHSPDGMRVSEISRQLGIVPSTLSGHLSILKRSGLLKSKRNQREIIYSVDLQTVNDMMLFIVNECCNGNLGHCAKTFRLLLSKSDPDALEEAKPDMLEETN